MTRLEKIKEKKQESSEKEEMVEETTEKIETKKTYVSPAITTWPVKRSKTGSISSVIIGER